MMKLDHIKGLDGIRAIAVILVIISHWISKQNILNYLPNGPIGVDIFFVLSGFLITRILIVNRSEVKSEESRNFNIIKSFYIRRILRIFPLYYLVLGLMYLLRNFTFSDIEGAFKFHFVYLSNFLFYVKESWDGSFSHLWSLSVEEQFYLIWPFLIVFSNRTWSLIVIFIAVLVGITSELYFIDDQFGRLLPISTLHSFGIGALISWLLYYNKELLLLISFRRIPVILFITSFIFLVLKVQYSIGIFPLRLIDSLIGGSLICIILFARSNSIVINCLEFSFVAYLGKISYGLYLLHNFIPTIMNKLLSTIFSNNSLLETAGSYYSILNLTVNSLTLLILASLSYRFFELPILSLKRKFEYKS